MFIAERQGFEPRVPCGTTVFKTAAIDHSATSPKLFSGVLPFKSDAKVRIFFEYAKCFGKKMIVFYLFSLFPGLPFSPWCALLSSSRWKRISAFWIS